MKHSDKIQEKINKLVQFVGLSREQAEQQVLSSMKDEQDLRSYSNDSEFECVGCGS